MKLCRIDEIRAIAAREVDNDARLFVPSIIFEMGKEYRFAVLMPGNLYRVYYITREGDAHFVCHSETPPLHFEEI